MNTLRINGVARAASPRKGGLVISHHEALRVILASEAATEFEPFIRDELPAIVSHWLQSPKDPPILVDPSFGEKWVDILRLHCQLKNGHNPASGAPRETKHPKPVYINFGELPFPPVMKPKFTFIDLFAGIGGFRIALESLGGKCVFSSEWDRHAKETYFQNYGEVPFGDIQALSNRKLISNDVDIIAGGFPCQPFSRAGVSARESLGLEHGFECETQGQLFFDVINMAKIHQPKMLYLENVGNLMRHDGGNTFLTIKKTIEDELGYKFSHRVYNANPLVPQSRVRCLIVAYRPDCSPSNWEMPKLSGDPLPLRQALDENISWKDSYTLSEAMWAGHQRRSKRNVERGTGFTAYPKDLDKPATTLVARYYKDGKECLIPQPDHPDKTPRMLSERECANLQGFPKKFLPHKSKVHAYKQFGNSVPVPLIEWVANRATKHL